VPEKLVAIEQVRPAAAEALRVFRLLRRDAPTTLRQLRAAKQQGARLTVAETIADDIVAIGPSAGFQEFGRQADARHRVRTSRRHHRRH
jgi:hypothetical protein